MDIGIIGLGLIGSSIARAIKKHTDYMVAGFDIKPDVMTVALSDGTLDAVGEQEACGCGIVFVCLYPGDAVRFIEAHAFPHIVCDVCGVKRFLSDRLSGKVKGYVGLHPMAGREVSGYAAGSADLFLGASLIIAKDKYTEAENIEEISALAEKIGFGRIVLTDPARHDRVIAYTSQLAHVVSSAYVKSDTAKEYSGYSAGSFTDLTRVARLDPGMWTELFLMNKENLSGEITSIIERLQQYQKALEQENAGELARLLKEGRDQKMLLDEMMKK